jgi:hypothetical protein
VVKNVFEFSLSKIVTEDVDLPTCEQGSIPLRNFGAFQINEYTSSQNDVNINVLLELCVSGPNSVQLIFDFGVSVGNINAVFATVLNTLPQDDGTLNDATIPVFSQQAQAPFTGTTITLDFTFTTDTGVNLPVERVIKQGTIILTRIRLSKNFT